MYLISFWFLFNSSYAPTTNKVLKKISWIWLSFILDFNQLWLINCVVVCVLVFFEYFFLEHTLFWLSEVTLLNSIPTGISKKLTDIDIYRTLTVSQSMYSRCQCQYLTLTSTVSHRMPLYSPTDFHFSSTDRHCTGH